MTTSNNKFEQFIIICKGEIEFISPLIIGSGEDDNTDCDLLKDYESIPFIPGTSFAGIIRSHFKNHYDDDFKVNDYFGFSKDKEGKSSKIFISDLILTGEPKIQIRDGIKIDNKTGIVYEDKSGGAKFNYEVLEQGAKFDFNIEIKSNDDEKIKKFIKTLQTDITEERLCLGAKTKSGFGKFKISKHNCSFYDLHEKEDLIKWLNKDKEEKDLKLDDISTFEYKSKEFIIDFEFVIKDSLIVKHYTLDPEESDSVHIQSNGKNIIPGTSIKGAIRARAERIINTLKLSNGDIMLKYLFGDKKKQKDDNYKGSIPSRIKIEEVVIEQGVERSKQQRIKIDRFTGGTIDGALFDSIPVFFKNDENNKLKIKIENPFDSEIGLMLLVLKDLWTEDLPIGGEKNIGRGLLRGKNAKIKYKDNEVIEISDDICKETKQRLEAFVKTISVTDYKKQYEKCDKIYGEKK